MADKEATVYIIDVGASMGAKHHGRTQSDLDWAMTYVWDKITSTVAMDRKTTHQAVIGLKTLGTANELSGESAFDHISVLQGLGTILLPDLRRLQGLIKVSKTGDGDAISALIIAIQVITTHCKKLKYARKIVLVTNGRGSMDTDDIPEITKKIHEDDIQLVVLGVDFDDPEYEFVEEGKDPEKAENEAVLKALADECGGVYGTLAQAIDELGLPRIKPTKPIASYKGDLQLGDFRQYPSTTMCIRVERYPRTMVKRPATASSYVQRSDHGQNLGHRSITSSAAVLPDTDGDAGAPGFNNLAPVRNARTYRISDETAPGGKRDVDPGTLAKGYEYGRTAVHISESDLNVTRIETELGLSIVGFIPWVNYERYMHLSTSRIIIPQKADSKSIMALSSLIHALHELESFAVARLVPKDEKPPVLVLLAPSIEPEYECLLDVELPFAEDVRSYKFPPLDRVVTVSGKTLKVHRNLPGGDLNKAMSDYVDRMDLSSFGEDDDGNPTEYMKMEDTFSPVLHRIDQAVRWRAIHPDKPIPPPYEILTRYSKPPGKLLDAAKPDLAKLITTAAVKQVPPKVMSRKRVHEQSKPISGLDVDALLGREKRAKISPDNAIPEFRQMLNSVEDPSGIQAAAAEFGSIINERIINSIGDDKYAQAVAELTVLRQEMLELEEPEVWNEYVRRLKGKLIGDGLGGGRDEIWWQMRKARLGLITPKELGGEASKVTDEEARLFLLAK